VSEVAGRLLSIGLCLGLTTAANTVAAPAQAAVTQAPPGSVGYDVSSPQCTSATSANPVPSGATFAILGVTDRQPFQYYACLQNWYAPASLTGVATGLYVNTANPGPESPYWPKVAATATPLPCGSVDSADDNACAYDYGYAAGQNAFTGAQKRAKGMDVKSRVWWLDVERGNTWAGLPSNSATDQASATDKVANTAELQGEIDGLYAAGVAQVGIYSTGVQWQQITGGYNRSDAASYQSAWKLPLSYPNPVANAPLWIPGGSDEYGAWRNCAGSFTGAQTLLVQYPDPVTKLDADLVCGGAAPATIAGAPRKPAAKAGPKKGTVSLSWQAPSSTGGEPITGYLIYRGTSGGHLSSYRTVPCTSSACSWTDSGAKHAKRYYYKVAALNEVGTGHQSTYVTAKGK
jgi:hypothetical protein